MNVLNVYDEMKESIKQARDKRIPSLVEIKTYRYRGHSMSDPAKYRTKEELQEYKEQDPILILKKDMIKANLLKEEEFQKLDREFKDMAQASVDFAENSPEREMHELYENVLA